MSALSKNKRKLLEQRLAGRGKSGSTATIGKCPDNAAKKISPGQRRVWVLCQTDLTSPAYNITNSYWVGGEAIDLVQLEAAANCVVQRHAILRTTFIEGPEGVCHVVDHAFRLRVESVQADVDGAVATAQREAMTRFDLSRSPAIRLVHVSGERSLLMLVSHDMIFDKWSLGLFWRELAAFYDGRSLPELPIQYEDFAYWQHRQLEHGLAEKQLAYWQDQLSDLPEPLEIPTDHRRPNRSTDRGALERALIDLETTEALKVLAASQNCSMFMMALLGFKILLQRYTGQTDLIVGSPVANRRYPELADLVGFFLSTVAIRSQLGGDLTVAEALDRIRISTLGALNHQDVPFDRVVEYVKPTRIPGRHPVFQVMLVFQRNEEAVPLERLGGSTFEMLYVDTQTSKFDLTLFVAERDGGLELLFEYRKDLFESNTVGRMLAHLGEIFRAIGSSPQSQLSELSMLSSNERESLFQNSRGEELEIVPQRELIETILAHGVANPSAVAMVEQGVSLTYAELDKRSSKLAATLKDLGVEPGAMVGLAIGRSMDAIVGILAILRCGAAYVPIDPSHPLGRCQQIIRDCGAKVVVSDSTKFKDVACVPVAAGTDHAICSRVEVDLEAAAYVIYTSGSTGTPKGVVVSHRNLAHSTAARCQFYRQQPKRFLLVPNLAFDSSVAGIFWTLSQGAALVMMPDGGEQDIDAFSKLIEREFITHMLCLPSLYGLLLKYAPIERMRSLINVMVAGEVCPPSLAKQHHKKLPQVLLCNEYGPTEATVWCTAHVVNDGSNDCIPIGRPIPGAMVYILDESMRLVPDGVPGELFVGGAGVAGGYLGDPVQTRERFINDPFVKGTGRRLYRTGDLGKRLPDGAIVFLGRRDEQVKIRGYRIELREIEQALKERPEIDDAVAVVVANDTESQLCGALGKLGHDAASRILKQVEGS